ncbi:hypothetical protein AYO38_04120 [bacterium SCGC AG-212-C10]|nr:hypothetical protein AYO38_04120 [bacterium SCGC AG-212-C10]
MHGIGEEGTRGTSQSVGQAGVRGIASGAQGCTNSQGATNLCYGVIGDASTAPFLGGIGVMGIGSNSGIWGRASVPGANAGLFDGRVYVNGLIDGPGATLTTVSARPDLGNTRDLGTATFYWRSIYHDHLFDQSDARLKQNIAFLPYGLQAVLALSPVSYEMIGGDGGRQLGLLAQDVEAVIPEIVRESEDEQHMLSLDYVSLVPVLINAIHEQQTQIDELKRSSGFTKCSW